MAKQIVFFYLMADAPDRVREAVPAHVAYWKQAAVDGYLGGPFADRSGGLITFESESLEDATAIIERDPFITAGLLESKWIREWMPERGAPG